MAISERKEMTIKPKGNIEVSDGESMRQLALNGMGLASFQVKVDIKAGRLIPILENYNPGDTEPLIVTLIGKAKCLNGVWFFIFVYKLSGCRNQNKHYCAYKNWIQLSHQMALL